MFRRLLSVEDAKKVLKENFTSKAIGAEEVPISEALHRVLAEDVVASINVPPFDRSMVDGYAVKAEDTFGADEAHPVTLRVCGLVRVGEPAGVAVERGKAVLIATGATMPRGSDAVVMFEHTVQRDETVLVYESVSKGENVMRTGSDIRKGEIVLRKGKVLSPHEVGVLAALGNTRTNVYKRPKVAILSTGVEIVEPGRPLPEGKIYDINAYTLSSTVKECGGEPINLGIVQDEADQMKATLKNAINLADVIITSGGVSVGPTDIIPSVLNELGKPGVIVYGVAARPGKPTVIAVVNGKLVFSLPGNPASALVMFNVFVRPILMDMAGKSIEEPILIKAGAAEKMFSAMGRRTFVMVRLARDESGRVLASPVPPGLSGAITTLAKADGFVEIHEGRQFIDAGEEVTVKLFDLDAYTALFRERSR